MALPATATLFEIGVTAAATYGLYKWGFSGCGIAGYTYLQSQGTGQETEEEEKRKFPPYTNLPDDPSKCPAEGFERKGKGKGAWHNKEKDHSLYPDLDNPAHDPRWDFSDAEGKEYRIYLDNSWEPKN